MKFQITPKKNWIWGNLASDSKKWRILLMNCWVSYVRKYLWMNGLEFMRRIIKSNLVYLIFASLFLWSCKTYNTSILKNGDLLFVPSVDSGLSGAINNVTQTEKKTSYDHIGILKKEENHFYVLHAAPKGGSQKQKLNHFLREQTKQGQKIDVYRLKEEY